MLEEGLEPTPELYTSLLAACYRSNLLDKAFSIPEANETEAKPHLVHPESDNSAQLSQIDIEKVLAHLIEAELNKRLDQCFSYGLERELVSQYLIQTILRKSWFLKSEYFEKVEQPLQVKGVEGHGLLNLKGDKWAQHRKIIKPIFYTDNLKLEANGAVGVDKYEFYMFIWFSNIAVRVSMWLEVKEWLVHNMRDIVVLRL
ncbi:cytochrome p450 734a1 [Phtheirospermum japonicum]|uniref:Cytochrome p450 734a1 n=1 Tax=Phtheirospermum japonicum TaxID=374723 RepID=A0A830C1J0_9LAMI|nr:cytochrome p450 734a1 [Phtheirospermum japonicum]